MYEHHIDVISVVPRVGSMKGGGTHYIHNVGRGVSIKGTGGHQRNYREIAST